MKYKTIGLTTATVKVMRSYDYCHFEITLASSLDGIDREQHPQAVDELRKGAARLADHAVEQYKIARAAETTKDAIASAWELRAANNVPEDQRTPRQKAIIKYHQDNQFAAQFDYDYEDDYQPPKLD